MTLNDVPNGRRVRIMRHSAKDAIRQRLLDLGLMPGALIHIVRSAPLGDPIELHLDASRISIRLREAAGIEVQYESAWRRKRFIG